MPGRTVKCCSWHRPTAHLVRDLAGALSQDPGQGNSWFWDEGWTPLGTALLAVLVEVDPADGGLGVGARQPRVAGVALSSLVSSMLSGKSLAQGLRKVVSVASSARRPFLPNSWTQSMLKVTVG